MPNIKSSSRSQAMDQSGKDLQRNREDLSSVSQNSHLNKKPGVACLPINITKEADHRRIPSAGWSASLAKSVSFRVSGD